MADYFGRKLSEAPGALRLHVALVSAAAALTVTRSGIGDLWILLIPTVLILWFLLHGSLFAWWVEALGVAGALAGLYSSHQRVANSSVDLTAFFDTATALATAALVAPAAVLLLLPSTRRHLVWNEPPGANVLGKGLFVFAALLVASVPSMVLGGETRLPSERLVDDAEGATFLAGDAGAGIAFYAKETADGRVCLIHVGRNGSGSSCDDGDHNPPNVGRINADFSGIVAAEVVRVEIVGASTRYEAVVIERPELDANFFYLLDGPAFRVPVEVIGYDAANDEVFRRSL